MDRTETGGEVPTGIIDKNLNIIQKIDLDAWDEIDFETSKEKNDEFIYIETTHSGGTPADLTKVYDVENDKYIEFYE